MLALVLCSLAFVVCYVAGRWGLVEGLATLLAVGYAYGIIRANVPTTFSHFIFDAGVLGLYAAQLFRPLTVEDRERLKPLMPWVGLLIGWPAILVLIPLQDPMVQLVGLRAHVFFLPFLILGARLAREEVARLTLWLAVFNLVVFGFAVSEFFLGVERFYPRNEVTALIYRSRDIHTDTVLAAFRIPATFGNSASYGATMVATIPLLLGLWIQRDRIRYRLRSFLMLAIIVSGLGVFLAASRLNIMTLGVIVLATVLSGRFGVAGRLAWIGMIGCVAWIVSMEERLFQRILTLSPDTIIERLSWSVNWTLVDFALQYPLGNGLGGGGTSIPFFLQHLIRDPRSIENHYGAILLEQGVPGLFLWLSFIAWALTRRTTRATDPWYFGRRLLWLTVALFFGQGVIGQGLLTAVPTSALLMLVLGWLVVRQPSGSEVGAEVAEVSPQNDVRSPMPIPAPRYPAGTARTPEPC